MRKTATLQKIGYRKIIYLLVLLSATIPMLYPIGLPVIVTKQTQDLYEYIEKLPSGSNVAIEFAAYAGMYPDAQAATRAGLIHLFRRPLNIVLWHTTADGPMLLSGEMKYVKMGNRVYGKDHVFLPYVAGSEATTAALGTNIRGVFKSDSYGTPIDQIPLMKNINKAEDFAVILVMASAGGNEEWAVRQWMIPHHIPVGAYTISITYPMLIPYWRAGSVIGMTNGVRGGAEYEALIGSPGPGLRRTDVMSSVSLLYVALIVVANVEMMREKRPKQ